MDHSGQMESDERRSPSKCLAFLRVLWKFCKCIFSHVTLVSLVGAYCVLGAYAFELLESEHEKDVKRSIKYVRGNVTDRLWLMTQNSEILKRENWTNDTVKELRNFETELLKKMKKEGWDGSEGEDNIQWTFAGALFYSIIVITTIGYGHIAPKTQNGKVVTIFYAILGIPLMLLCLSNIGDVMASSFRFLYWRICCYVCTRPSKPRRVRSNNTIRGSSIRQSSGRSMSNRAPSLRRSIRASPRSAESSAFGLSENINRSTHLDVQSRRQTPRRFDINGSCNDSVKRSTLPTTASPRNLQLSSPSRHTYDAQNTTLSGGTGGKIRVATYPGPGMTQSLDRRLLVSHNDLERTPVLCNKYALEEPDISGIESNMRREFGDELPLPNSNLNTGEPGGSIYSTLSRASPSVIPRRCRSMDPGSMNNPNMYNEMSQPKRYGGGGSTRQHSKSNIGSTSRLQRREAPSPRIMSPMGFAVHRQIYADEVDYDDYLTPIEEQAMKPVPIWLCVFLVVSYILGGAVLFTEWESWIFLDSAYFCFITLTTIGFGDFVPAHKLNAHQGIVLCSLYLLFGIALLAMSFNLVQEEVIINVKSVAKRLGIIKEEASDYDDDDDEYNNREIEEYNAVNYNREYMEYPDGRQRQFYMDDGDIEAT
ncbi:hypothetical protein PV328_000127 [Microctonus aethiopoides]|uniref:Potassium channel domain-containing protein n=1 Tax=Microctonus aethiopoides TaxID=144406 RepID=A0AA39FUG8_9HYME|nr:hypothetical protein PV328_000127 [Microctonus aethiopoides]